MAIAIRPIPVLTGSTAERFEQMVEESRNTPFTIVPEELKHAMHDMLERSRKVIVKKPKHQQK